MNNKYQVLSKIGMMTALLALMACGGSASAGDEQTGDNSSVDANGQVVETESVTAAETLLPFSDESIHEHVVMDYGKRAVRSDKDVRISRPELVKNKKNCFIVMSKKDFYLYVYEPQGKDTVLIARYDCCFSSKKGNKERKGDMKTPHCTMKNPFSISQLADASTWHHDFGDGRGNIKAYGDYFLRLVTPGHSGIGIHGSTNNAESVPGRASEGCIRLLDADIIDLRKNYAFVGMKVVNKAEDVDDLPFEIHAMKRQHIKRLRHFDPKKTLTNEQLQQVTPEQGRVKGSRAAADSIVEVDERDMASVEAESQDGRDQKKVSSSKSANMTLEELQAQRKAK